MTVESAIESLLAENGLHIAGSAYLLNGQLVQINDALKSADEHMRPTTRFVVDANYGVSDEVRTVNINLKDGDMMIIGRTHAWAVHMGNLDEEGKRILFARMQPSELYDVVTLMEILVCDYGCSYELDDKGETICEATYEENIRRINDRFAELEELSRQFNELIEETEHDIDEAESCMHNTDNKCLAILAFGIIVFAITAFLIIPIMLA